MMPEGVESVESVGGVGDVGDVGDVAGGEGAQGAASAPAASAPAPRGPYEGLARVGRASWWVLGIVLLVILAVLGLARFSGLVVPSIVGMVLAATLSPLVSKLAAWRIPRVVGTLVVTLLIVGLLVFLDWQFVAIVADEGSSIWDTLRAGATDVDKWLGGNGAAHAALVRFQSVSETLQHGAVSGAVPLALRGVHAVYTLVVALFLAAGFTFLFLWEGPVVRRWVSGQLFVPEHVGLQITASLVLTTRRYVAGVSCIGALQAVIVGATALITGVGSWPVIAFAIFLGNYVPYVGGLVTGVFAVLLTLGAAGPRPAFFVLIAVLVSTVFVGPHIGVFFIGGAIRLPVTAVFVLTMTGATVVGFFGAAVAAPMARLIIDARAIVREDHQSVAAGAAPPGGEVAAGEQLAGAAGGGAQGEASGST